MYELKIYICTKKNIKVKKKWVNEKELEWEKYNMMHTYMHKCKHDYLRHQLVRATLNNNKNSHFFSYLMHNAHTFYHSSFSFLQNLSRMIVLSHSNELAQSSYTFQFQMKVKYRTQWRKTLWWMFFLLL